jgi:hypothetical protein
MTHGYFESFFGGIGGRYDGKRGERGRERRGGKGEREREQEVFQTPKEKATRGGRKLKISHF